jgi:hypothetical protein
MSDRLINGKERQRCLVVDFSADSVDPDSADLVSVDPDSAAVLAAVPVVLVADTATVMVAVTVGAPVGVAISSSARRSSPRRYCSTGRLMPRRSCNGCPTRPREHLRLPRTWQSWPLGCSPDGGVATLTEFGQNLLSWRGVSSETAHAFLGRAAKFGDAFKIRRELFEVAGLARTITWTGTEEQKQQLAEARTKVLEALREAKKTLHRVLGED